MRIVIVSGVLIAIVTLTATPFIDVLTEFLLVGAIPGTPHNVPPNAMMLGICIVAWITLSYVIAGRLLAFFNIRKLINRHVNHRRRLPKRRYGRIPSATS